MPIDLKSNAELKAMSLERLKGFWGMPILVCFLYGVFTSIGQIVPWVGFLIPLIVTGPLMFGLYKYFLAIQRGENPKLDVMFDGFKLFESTLRLYLLYILYVVLWTLLLIVPGIIAALKYSQAFYILNDRPELSASEALKYSTEMMDGQKEKLFMLSLSFLGWFILACFTFGIGFLWLIPYMQLTYANFYEDLKKYYNTNRD